MNLIILLTDEMEHPSNVEGVTLIEDYGQERVIKSDSNTGVTGNVLFVTGNPADLHKWLSPYGSVWVTNNPLAGNWEYLPLKGEM